ncbi:MAG: hypothetical protein AAF991_10720, partial [Pseudomonadota bacterium]
ELRRSHIYRRVDQMTVKRYDALFPMPNKGAYLVAASGSPMSSPLEGVDSQRFQAPVEALLASG